MDSVAVDKHELADQLNAVHEEIRLEATAFPEKLRHVRPTPEEWCAMELLGHIAEMHYSYVARAQNLMDSPGAELARDMQSPERIEAVQRGPTLSLEEALSQLEQARQHALAFLDRVAPEQMSVGGIHSSLGPMTVRDVFSRTIIGHARNHLNQLRAARDQVTG